MKWLMIIVLIGLCFNKQLNAQDQQEIVENTFRSINLVNGQTIETLWKNNLFFAISHRFTGSLTTGVKEFWGMDSYANIRLGLAYGITDRLMIGFGRTRQHKIYDGYIKYRLLQQAYDGIPISVSVFGQTGIRSEEFPDGQSAYLGFEDRLSYALQLMMARKMNEWLGVQLIPALTHQNLSTLPDQPNTRFSLGGGINVKVTTGMSLSAEYYLNAFTEDPNAVDVVGISIDFTSVRHSFQIQISNATTLTPAEFLAYSNKDFFSADALFLGFHITRKFGF